MKEKTITVISIILLFTSILCFFPLTANADEEASPFDSPFGRQDDPFENRSDEVLELMDQSWDYLMNQYHNPYAAAAIMASAHAESFFVPYRYEGDTYVVDGDFPDSKEYTADLDSGKVSRDEFASFGPNDGGYGLFAWTSMGRKEGLYDFAAERGVSVSDWRMQLDYAYQEIVSRYYSLYRVLLTSSDLRETTYAFLGDFEQSNATLSGKKRLYRAEQFYEHYCHDDSFVSPFSENDLLPVYGSYRYINETIVSPSVRHENIYVSLIQHRLGELGYYTDDSDGTFGFYTEKKLKEFQENNNLSPSGVVGPKEWALLAQDNLNTTMSEVWWAPED